MDQAVPFQPSARVLLEPGNAAAFGENCPTAMHPTGEAHATPTSAELVEPAGLGIDWTAQLVPFHLSARGDVTLPVELPRVPTAVQ